MAFPSGLLALAFTTIASATSTTIQTTFSATLAASGDLASYGSDMSSITFGPPSWATSTTELTTAATSATTSLTWCSEASCVQWPAPYGDVTTRNYASVSVTIVKISVTVDVFPHAITTTMSSISVLPDTWSSTTANSSPESTSLAAIKSTPGSQTPTSNWTAVQSCFQAHFDPGCGGMLQHVMDCYENQAPWVDPLNTTQSTAFQACLCQTSPSVRFSTNSVLWHDFTSCAFCLFGWVPINFYELLPEMQRIEEFCSSQTPFGYVFLPNLLDWLGSLYKGTTLAKPPLTGSITLITDMAPLCTPVPPLANLAYGASAPPDGILGALVPALTTFTTLQSNKLATITSLITWLPTATSEFTMASVESSAASVASRELASALYSWANASKTSGGHGGPIMERCSGLDRASADAIYCFPFTRALLVSVVAIGVVVVLQT